MDDMLKQAKIKALRLLGDMDRTEYQLRLRLKQNGYTEEVIEKTLEYVKSFHYIDDMGYAERFVANRQGTKSKQEIKALLYQKGIAGETVETALENCYAEYSEVDTIQNLMKKKHLSPEASSDEEKKRFFDYLVRKGFRREDIRQVIQVSFWNA